MLRCLLKHCNTKKYGRSEGTSSCILTVGTNMKLETSAKYQPPKNRVGMTLDSKAPEPPVIREWQCPRTPVNHRMAVPWSPQKPQNGSARAPGIHRCSAPEPPVSTDAVLQSPRYPQMQCSRATGIHRCRALKPPETNGRQGPTAGGEKKTVCSYQKSNPYSPALKLPAVPTNNEIKKHFLVPMSFWRLFNSERYNSNKLTNVNFRTLRSVGWYGMSIRRETTYGCWHLLVTSFKIPHWYKVHPRTYHEGTEEFQDVT